MTKEEYIQKAIAEAKSTSGSTYAVLALLTEIEKLTTAIVKWVGAVESLSKERDSILNQRLDSGNMGGRR